MSIVEKLLLVAVIAYFNESTSDVDRFADRIVSLNKLVEDYNDQISLLPQCSESISMLMAEVYPVGANSEYESQYDSASVCLNESRHKFNEFSQFLQTLASELGVEASEQADLPDILSIPSLNIEFDIRKVDELPLLREENRMKFLAALRNVYRRSPSVSSIHTDLSTIHMHLKEGNDLVVSFSLNDEYAHSIQSATLEPSYPCFQNAIEYAISRNDVALLVYQAISGLYASQRLHLEMERLQEKAVVTSEDDRSVEIVFPEEVEMTCMIPALYPNTFGLIAVKRIEGAKREVVEKALEGRAFGHLSELVQFVEETLRS